MSFVRDMCRVLGMACREHTELLSRQLDAPLSRGEAFGLAVHVRVCAGCREFRSQLRRMRELGGALGREVGGVGGMPEAARERLRRRMEELGGRV